MSRTFRRKNYEKEVRTRAGSRQFGFYREWDNPRGRGWGNLFRAPTEEEYFKEYWRIHGESNSANYWTPGRWYRRNRMKQNRMINRQEIIRFLKNYDYEPMCETNPRSHYWDWS